MWQRTPAPGWARRGQGLPERLGLDVLDHDRVDELPPAVVGAEPACHIPGGSVTQVSPEDGGQEASGVFSDTSEAIPVSQTF